LGDQIGGYWMCGCHRDYFSVCVGQAQKIKNARPVEPFGTGKRSLHKNWGKNGGI
jgi:hypothetical protein